MDRGIVRALTALTILALAACSGGSRNASLLPQAGAVTGAQRGDIPFVGANPVRRLCPSPVLGRMACMGMVRTDIMPTVGAGADVEGDAEKCPFEQEGVYCPSDLQDAYLLPSLTKGGGRVVAIVDAFGYHHAAADLAEYRKTMGLKACSTATKCLRIVNQNGGASPLPPEPPPSDDWKGEESLDLDMVSAICPNCRIVLVQANNDDTGNLYDGVKTAGRLGAKYIGVSWGGPEFGGDNPIFHQPGVIISASAGDEGGGGSMGGGPEQPCTYTYVVCVGGTHLVRGNNTRGWSENVWNDWTLDECSGPCGATGSGCSKKIAKPNWQTDTQCRMRSEADVSATASLRAPVAVYNSEEGCTPPNCWFAFGGTSASVQIISAVFALAGHAATEAGASKIWRLHDHLYDAVRGNNLDPHLGVVCASPVKYICTARVGFDGPTGWGSPKGLGAF